MDQLPYFPESAPMMDNILYKVYGVDLFTPDCKEMRAGALNSHEGRFLWESRTRQQWQDLAREFGFTDVITYEDWRLDLPVKTPLGPFLVYTVQE